MKKLIPTTYRRTLGIWTPVALLVLISFFLQCFFFFPVLSVVACIKLLILLRKSSSVYHRPSKLATECKFYCSFIFLSALHSFHCNLSFTEFSLLSSFVLLCCFHLCYLYFLPSVVWEFISLSDLSSINCGFPVLLSGLLYFFSVMQEPLITMKVCSSWIITPVTDLPILTLLSIPIFISGLIQGLVIHSWLLAEITILVSAVESSRCSFPAPQKELCAIIFLKSYE